MSKVITITSDGRVDVADAPDNGDDLEFMQDFVGGYVECYDFIHAETGLLASMWINEEALYLPLFYNPIASKLLSRDRNCTMRIVGDVVITGPSDDEGETTYFDGPTAAVFAENIRNTDITLDLVQ